LRRFARPEGCSRKWSLEKNKRVPALDGQVRLPELLPVPPLHGETKDKENHPNKNPEME